MSSYYTIDEAALCLVQSNQFVVANTIICEDIPGSSRMDTVDTVIILNGPECDEFSGNSVGHIISEIRFACHE